MRSLLSAALLAAATLAAPAPQDAAKSSSHSVFHSSSNRIVPTTYEPPPLWDPPIARPPPLFEAPAEDMPELPLSLLKVLEAPVQAVRIERLSGFTGSTQHPVDNIYQPSSHDPDASFDGEGSLRPAPRTVVGCVVAFVQTWIWWISVVVLACLLVYVAEKMCIGAIIGAKRARSASRVASSRAASLVAGTRSRAASLVGGRGRASTLNLWQEKVKLERSRSPPVGTRSWDDSMV